MKKQFVIYDFSSQLFLASVNEQGVVWDTQPMLFDSEEEANNSLQNAYKLFPDDFNDRLTTVTNVYITEQAINDLKK
jgi:hypothetical protein